MKPIMSIAPFCLLAYWLWLDVHLCKTLHPTEKYARNDSLAKDCQPVRILFYNLENLYDTKDDSLVADESFTPAGDHHWVYRKLTVKLHHLFKTILAAGNPEPPALIGFCEVENRGVLNRLIYDTPLKQYGYRIVHRDGPDRRGVDVALLVRKGKAEVVASGFTAIRFPFDTAARTREILYACIRLPSDTLHLFVNHWPSRLGGYAETREKRNFVALRLRECVDSILTKCPGAKVVVMGDFNDGPAEESLHEVLQAKGPGEITDSTRLINLMWDLRNDFRSGTHKYQGEWNILDQFIVSRGLFLANRGLRVSAGDAVIFRGAFLMETDERYLGDRPSRTNAGPRYLGGFSDHLPVFLDLHCPK